MNEYDFYFIKYNTHIPHKQSRDQPRKLLIKFPFSPVAKRREQEQ